jgi:hypothetical protein
VAEESGWFSGHQLERRGQTQPIALAERGAAIGVAVVLLDGDPACLDLITRVTTAWSPRRPGLGLATFVLTEVAATGPRSRQQEVRLRLATLRTKSLLPGRRAVVVRRRLGLSPGRLADLVLAAEELSASTTMRSRTGPSG